MDFRRVLPVRALAAMLLLCAHTLCFAQPDYAREKRWADEVVPGLVVGDAVYLTQGSRHRFLAIYTAVPKASAAIMLVHAMGVHPDWALIGALRSGLADQGYATLSVQMPVLSADASGENYPALFGDAAERMHIAAAFLEAKGHRRIVLVSHSVGSRMGNFFLAGNPGNSIVAWVSVGISSGEFDKPDRVRIPVLDIYGQHDFPQVLKKAATRATWLRTLKGSAQIEVAGADHYFSNSESELLRRVRQFLDQRLR